VKTGVQRGYKQQKNLDCGFRRNDEKGPFPAFFKRSAMMNVEQGISNHELRSPEFFPWTMDIPLVDILRFVFPFLRKMQGGPSGIAGKAPSLGERTALNLGPSAKG
jgi:hypothetical protein